VAAQGSEVGEKLTAAERHALEHPLNLADAHTRQRVTGPLLREVIEELGELFQSAERTPQADLERRFLETFLTASGQACGLQLGGALLCYSASSAMEIVANHLRLTRLRRVALVEPTFDNIPDILTRHGLVLSPVSAELYDYPSDLVRRAVATRSSVLFLVMPNNPTGHRLPPSGLFEIATACKDAGLLLCLDFSFRLFDDEAVSYDQYEILRLSGVSFIGIEDTGKIWPLLDQKASILLSSSDILTGLTTIHDDFLLNISPLTLAVVEKACRISSGMSFSDVTSLIRTNRSIVTSDLMEPSGGRITRPFRLSCVSVDFLALHEASLRRLLPAASSRGVAVLPGRQFYWSAPRLGNSTFRIALARDTSDLRRGVAILTEELRRLSRPGSGGES